MSSRVQAPSVPILQVFARVTASAHTVCEMATPYYGPWTFAEAARLLSDPVGLEVHLDALDSHSPAFQIGERLIDIWREWSSKILGERCWMCELDALFRFEVDIDHLDDTPSAAKDMLMLLLFVCAIRVDSDHHLYSQDCERCGSCYLQLARATDVRFRLPHCREGEREKEKEKEKGKEQETEKERKREREKEVELVRVGIF